MPHTQTATKFYIHKSEVALNYGGPEEGGWWFDAGTPSEDWKVLEFDTEEQAYEKCRQLNDLEHQRRDANEDYDYTSVLAHRSTHYSYSVEDYPDPEQRPYYC